MNRHYRKSNFTERMTISITTEQLEFVDSLVRRIAGKEPDISRNKVIRGMIDALMEGEKLAQAMLIGTDPHTTWRC
jgi:hypothetical protein